MYVQADDLPADSILSDYDICIVGAGAAGIAMAQRLANTSVKVLLLVSGQPGRSRCARCRPSGAVSGHGRRLPAAGRPRLPVAFAPEYVRRHHQPLWLLGASTRSRRHDAPPRLPRRWLAPWTCAN